MDLHPAPVAKRRVAVKPTLKSSMFGPNAQKEKTTQPLAPAKPRPKRAFGVSRNTNIPVEKAQLKQQKPTGAIVKPAKRNGKTPENAKVTPTERKKQLQKVHSKEDKEKKKEEAMQTPLSKMKKVVEDGTPYLSAFNCSKCRFDRLETSSYWLNQIRLSEAVGKHFVSATFFRLALECHAQPFEKIRSELKHYTKRHQATSTVSLFVDLLQSYKLSSERPKSEHARTLITKPNKAAHLFESHKDEPEETTISSVCKIEKCALEERHDCSADQRLHTHISDIGQQHKCEFKQDETVKTEHCEVDNPVVEVNDKLKPTILKDCSSSASEKGEETKLNKMSPSTRDSLSSKISTTCLENTSLTKKAGNNVNELSKSKGEQAAKREKTESISKTKERTSDG